LKKKDYLHISIILAISILFKLYWFFSFKHSPLFDSPAIDEALHWQWAMSIAETGQSPEIPFFRAPLYLWWLGFLKSLGLNISAMRLSGLFLGLCNNLLLFAIALRFMNSTAAKIILLFSGFSASLIYFEPQLLIVHWLIFWLLLSSWLLLESVNSDQKLRIKLVFAWFSGLAIGLAVISRPNTLLLIPFILLIAFFAPDLKRLRIRIMRFLLVLMALAGPILLVANINGWPASGVLIASQGGVNFWIGNNPDADGSSASLPGVGNSWERADARVILADSVKQSSAVAGLESKFYYSLGREWIRNDPRAAFNLYLSKVKLLAAPFEIGNNSSPHELSAHAPILNFLLKISWWLVLIPGVFAIALGYPGNRILRKWCITVILLWSLSLLLFFVNSRFRLPIIPFLLLPAAELLADIFGTIRKASRTENLLHRFRRSNTAGLIIFGMLLVASFKTLPDDGLKQRQEAWSKFQEANAYFRLNKTEAAEEMYQRALKLDPELRELRLNLGILAEQSGDLPTAFSMYQQELLLNPQSAKALNNLANLQLAQGNLLEAEEAYLLALNTRPGFEDAAWNLGRCRALLAIKAIEDSEMQSARSYLDQLEFSPYRGVELQRLIKLLGQ
jgi:tetratricopeptide (TPR) repeat protein